MTQPGGPWNNHDDQAGQYEQHPDQPPYPTGQYPPPEQQPYQQFSNAPQYPYPQQYLYTPPYTSAQPQGTNSLAVGALVASCIGLVSCGLGGLLGIVLGIMALGQVKRTGQDGRGLAIAGIAVGGVIVTLVVAYFVILGIAVSTTT